MLAPGQLVCLGEVGGCVFGVGGEGKVEVICELVFVGIIA